ncbi:endospore germination permease [Paenibacillus solisilvae]|uniref:Endospore germination permease n=1 Tax=Paenibacillus solisilvae TaxID=2486751 RepID=A0ABW0W937_9BACL
MLEKGKISAFQMAFLMFPTTVSTGVLLVPSISERLAGRDMWMTPLIGSIAGYLIVYVAITLHKLYPQKTLVEYSVQIVGLIPGKIIGAAVLLFFLHMNAVIVRQYGEFLVGNFLPQTPLLVVMASMLLVCSYTIRGGIEAMARSSQLIAPLVLVLITMLSLLLLPDMDFHKMLPVLENGIVPVLKGSIVLQSWNSAFFLITFVLPSLKDPEKAMKWGMISVFSVMLTLLLASFVCLFMFGDRTSEMLYPLMSAARYISFADFFEHLEAIVMAIWVMGNFIQMIVFYYGVVLGTAQLLNLKDFRPLVIPVNFLILLLGLWISPNLAVLSKYLGTLIPFETFFMRFLIPVLLLFIAWIRRSNRRQGGAESRMSGGAKDDPHE